MTAEEARSRSAGTARIALTPGEPAGVGPDLLVRLAQEPQAMELVAVTDPGLLAARAAALGLPLRCLDFDPDAPAAVTPIGAIRVWPVTLAAPVVAGRLDPRNAPQVIETLRLACDGCLAGTFDALVTGPVHKAVINDAGIPFSGHTEFLAERCDAQPVMLLATPGLRVALVTTHLPLKDVSAAISAAHLERVILILERDLRERFGIPRPRILVCGLNPHAGEGGHLGLEEIEIISPTLERLRHQGLDLIGPLPADTAFVPAHLANADAVLAMYHDQGLPVLKHLGFGSAANITLGLPIIRTSVDHGTALDLAGTTKADMGSLRTALRVAEDMIEARNATGRGRD